MTGDEEQLRPRGQGPEGYQTGEQTVEELARLRKVGRDPRQLFVASPVTQQEPPKPKRKKKTKPENQAEILKRKALRSLVQFAEAIKAERLALEAKLEQVDMSLDLLTGKVTAGELRDRKGKSREGNHATTS